MGGKSNIEWTERTWNPIVGCSIVSPGCTKCYAMKMAARIEAMNAGERAKGKPTHAPHYDGTTKKVNGHAVWTGKLAPAPDSILMEPLRRKKPTMWFVNSMSDLFHEAVTDEQIDRVFAVMALCSQHTFQVLTKRAERMRNYASNPETRSRVAKAADAIDRKRHGGAIQWPLPNVWTGCSCERQKEADERIPLLLQTPAAVRFISAEPLLGPIDFTPKADSGYQRLSEWYRPNGFDETGSQPRRERMAGYFPRIDWIIVGGESGPGARPFDIDWARSILRQCEVAGVRAFMKQLGSNPYSDERPMHGQPRGKYDDPARWPPELRVRQFPITAT